MKERLYKGYKILFKISFIHYPDYSESRPEPAKYFATHTGTWKYSDYSEIGGTIVYAFALVDCFFFIFKHR